MRSIEDYTGFPEILDGRVKTLHPSIFAGLLAVRSREDHRVTLAEHGIAPIDLVVVNLYPFERTAARRGVTDEEVIEHIDIGGPTLIRAAAKNHAHVGVVVRPESYDAVIEELSETGGSLSAQTRESLATEAFGATARYDAAISRWFAEREDDFPNQYVAAFEKVLDLSYGENPHQRAAYYEQVGMRTHLLARTVKVHGKELSFNNLLDLDSGRRLVNEFEVPAAAIIKHNNPCGTAVGETILDAYERALASDPQSAYGGVVVLNREIDVPLAEKLAENFIELLFAPGYTHEALEILRSKPNMRIIEDSERRKGMPGERDLRKVMGGVMLQDRDSDFQERGDMEVVTRAQAHRGGVGRAAVRLESRAARALERDRDRERARHGRHRRRPDEPRGRGALRRREGAGDAARQAGGLGARVGCVLPVRRRARGRDRGRRQGDHPAGRLQARSGSDRRVRRRRRRDGLHGPPPLPPLAASLHPAVPFRPMPEDLRNRSAQEVLDDHLNIAENWGEGSMEEILEADLRRNVAEDIVILINRGTFRGHDGVRKLAMMLAEELPEHTAFQYTYTAVEGKMAFLEWAYEDSTTRVRDGADST